MDKRLEKIVENMEQNALGIDDEFHFKCRVCGKCCKNRHDIMLTTRDLYNIAHELHRTTGYVVDRYCEAYIGGSSRIPIVRLKPTGPDQACPLMRDKRCIVHTAKPVVCAIYPLGRAVNFEQMEENDETKIKPTYFFQPDACGSRDQVHTVRSWLNQFGIPVEDEFFPLWTEMNTLMSTSFRDLESQNTPDEPMNRLWDIAFFHMYISYDTEKDLMPQYRENMEKIRELLALVDAPPDSLQKVGVSN